MTEPEDDTTGTEPPDAASTGSAHPVADESHAAASSSESTPPSVAAQAGIDEEALDVPRPLTSTVRVQWVVGSTVAGGILSLIIAGIALAIGSQTSALPGTVQGATNVGGAVFAVAFLFGVVRALLLYRSWSYVVRADSLFLSRGVFTRVRTVVPYVRVQHIDTRRGPLERVLGLSTLVVYTAGSRGADVTIPGLTPDRASTLQHRLERLAIESEEADAV